MLSVGISGGAAGAGARDPIVGNWKVTYGGPSVVSMTLSSGTYTETAVTTVPVTAGVCSLPVGTVIATFSATGPGTYSGQHGLWYTNNCAYAGSTTFSLTLAGNKKTLAGSLGNGEKHTFTKTTPPGAPHRCQATAGVRRATVRWAKPKHHGNTVTIGYVVTPYLGGRKLASRTYKSTATRRVVTGLKSGKRYRFRVAAKNRGGVGPMSAPSAAVLIR
jgi:hypothetical protein